MVLHPNLQTPIGNTSVIYISRNNVTHLYRSEDPVFSATHEIHVPLANINVYVPNWERRLSALACVESLQLCNDFGRGRECSAWVGVLKGENNETGVEEFYNSCTREDKGLISLIKSRYSGLTVGQLASGSGNNIVTAQSLLSRPIPGGRMIEVQTARGNDQWKAEVAQCMVSHVSFAPLSLTK